MIEGLFYFTNRVGGCFLFVLKLRGFSWVWQEDLVGQQRGRSFLFLVLSFSSEAFFSTFSVNCNFLLMRPYLLSRRLCINRYSTFTFHSVSDWLEVSFHWTFHYFWILDNVRESLFFFILSVRSSTAGVHSETMSFTLSLQKTFLFRRRDRRGEGAMGWCLLILCPGVLQVL